MQFAADQLDNGLKIITETNSDVHSVAVGFFVRTGARDETAEVSGVSHFLEHMAFKGNDKYDADDINRMFDELGANFNASTSEEVTLYYASVLPEYLPKTFELLSILIRPSLRLEDFEIEKKVILEEIGMYEDQPWFTCYDKTMQAHFTGHPLGQCILGTTESVSALTAEQMRAYHEARYCAGNITLAVAGKIEHADVMALAKQHCESWSAGSTPRDTAEANPAGGFKFITRDSSQQQYVMQMSPAPSADDRLRFAAQILAVIVGDESGSRLFWNIVDPGTADACEIGYYDYDGSGTWLTYLSCQPEVTQQNLTTIESIFEDVNKNNVTQEELETARNKAASRIVLRSERPMGRLSSLGNNWVYMQEYRSVEDDLQTLQSITLEDIRALLDKYPLGNRTTVALGPLSEL